MAESSTELLSGTAQGFISDIERLLDRRLGQFQQELEKELGKMLGAGASLGSGMGMAALGTILGGLGFVHLLNRVTGLPLWLCYGVSSAIACSAAAGLVSKGVEQVNEMDVVPEGAGRVVKRAVAANGR
jgi:hypothetical protein